MRILLQFPEGLKKEALSYAQRYSKEGHEVILSASACYGACDLALDEAKAVNAEKIIHFGHAPFIREKLPLEIEYVEYHVDADLEKMGSAASKLAHYKKISLGTTVQHVHQLSDMVALFAKHGIRALTGKGFAAHHGGQVLGCDALAVTRNAKDCDAIVFVGDGLFHALAIDNDKPVFVIHPKSGELHQINDEVEGLRKRRRGAVIAAAEAKTFGILVSTKPGQFNLEAAKMVKKEIEKRGRNAEILVSNELNPMALQNFMAFDAYVNTACPRLADDSEMFGKPVLNPGDLKLLFELF